MSCSVERPGVLRDIERSADLATRSTVPDVGCLVTKILREAPARWVEVEQDGQFWAFFRTESQAYLDDADNVELWSLRAVVERNPGLRQFAALAGAGTSPRASRNWPNVSSPTLYRT